MSKTETIGLEQAMAGILALLAAERDDQASPGRRPEDRRKTEVILSEAGLTPAHIGQILGKRAKTVSKTLERARKRANASGEGANDE